MSSHSSYILSGPEDDSNIPKESLGKIVFDSLRNKNPDEVLNVDAVTKDALTCRRLLEQSIKCTTIFKNLGIRKGDIIAIVSENSINYFIPVIAAFYVGVAVNPLNPSFSEGELKHCLLLSQPKLVLASQIAIDTVLKLKDELQFIEFVLLMGPRLPEACVNIKSIEHLLEEVSTFTSNFQPEQFDCSQQTALIVSSSGTTGPPKGVMLSHENLRLGVSYFGHPRYINSTFKDTTVMVLPFFHIFGPVIELVAFVTSMKCIIMNKFQPELFLQCIQQHKATKLFLVPPLVQFLAKSPLIDKYDLSSLKSIVIGAAPLGKDTLLEALRRLNDVNIQQGYGLTELAGAVTFQVDTNKAGSVGTLLPAVTAKICNPETKEAVGPLEIGELCFKGSLIMKGYIPAQPHLDKDGFFHSGDVGYYDHDGYFYIVDRMKELIKYKGFQVPPAELETLLITHPLIKDCGVIGIPDEKAGEVPLAFIVLENGTTISEREIVDFVAERISVQKHLYGGVRFVEEIPRTPSGKILRRKLIEVFHGAQ